MTSTTPSLESSISAVIDNLVHVGRQTRPALDGALHLIGEPPDHGAAAALTALDEAHGHGDDVRAALRDALRDAAVPVDSSRALRRYLGKSW